MKMRFGVDATFVDESDTDARGWENKIRRALSGFGVEIENLDVEELEEVESEEVNEA